jgi:hypothetical protein
MKNDLSAEQLQQPVNVTLPLGLLLRVTNGALPAAMTNISMDRPRVLGLPAIGAEFLGGIYAGLSVSEERRVALILLPGDVDDSNWNDATAWAFQQGGALPSRFDHLVLFKNLKSEFKEQAYWSCAPDAGDESDAWYQDFSDGSQFSNLKFNKLRARAVRRIAI